MADKTGIEWTDSTWSPLRFRVKMDAPSIARDKGYTSLVQIAEKMQGRVGPHCEHVSPGCANCYAETNNHRCLPANGTGLPYDRRSRDLVEVFLDQKALLQPFKWKSIVEHAPGCKRSFDESNEYCGCTRPRRIFVENQSDLFGEWVPDELLDQVFAIMALSPQHTYQVLTKRPERMLAYLETRTDKNCYRSTGADSPYEKQYAMALRVQERILELFKIAPPAALDRASEINELAPWFPLPNVWLGASAENQETANARIPVLLKTPAAVRFVSCEPLLGAIDLTAIRYQDEDVECEWNALTAYHQVLHSNSMDAVATADDGVTKLDWVIAGGESGPNARPTHPYWAGGLLNQCLETKTPFFFKQWGVAIPGEPLKGGEEAREGTCCLHFDGYRDVPDCCSHTYEDTTPEDMAFRMIRMRSKKSAGALLDGREWRQFPEVRA